MAADAGGGSGRGVRPRVAIGLRGGAIRRSDGSVSRRKVKQSGYRVMEKPRGVMAPKPTSQNASSAANKFSKAQRKGYAAMNRQNSARIATNRMRKATPSASKPRGTTGLKSYPGGNTPGGAIGRAHQSFFDIGAFLRGLGR